MDDGIICLYKGENEEETSHFLDKQAKTKTVWKYSFPAFYKFSKIISK